MDLRFGFSTEAIQKQPISCIVMSKRNIWQKLCSRCRSQIFPVWSHEESVERGWLSPSDIWAGRKWQLRMMISKQWRMPQFGVDQSLSKKTLEHFNGISVKNFPLKRDEKEILTFLIIMVCPPSSSILTSILTMEHKVQVSWSRSLAAPMSWHCINQSISLKQIGSSLMYHYIARLSEI